MDLGVESLFFRKYAEWLNLTYNRFFSYSGNFAICVDIVIVAAPAGLKEIPPHNPARRIGNTFKRLVIAVVELFRISYSM